MYWKRQVLSGKIFPGLFPPVTAVEEKIGSELYICEEPEIVGAAGAALYALEKYGV